MLACAATAGALIFLPNIAQVLSSPTPWKSMQILLGFIPDTGIGIGAAPSPLSKGGDSWVDMKDISAVKGSPGIKPLRNNRESASDLPSPTSI